MDPGPARCSRQHLTVFANRGIVEPLALVRFTRCLVQPHGIGRDRREPHGLQVGEVREEPARVIEHLGVVRVELRQAQRDVDRIAISSESRVDALEMESSHPLQDRIARTVRRPWSRPAAPPRNGQAPTATSPAAHPPSGGSASTGSPRAAARWPPRTCLAGSRSSPGVPGLRPCRGSAGGASRMPSARRHTDPRRAHAPLLWRVAAARPGRAAATPRPVQLQPRGTPRSPQRERGEASSAAQWSFG